MHKEIRMGVECSGLRRNLLWISLQRDGSISIGFVDQICIVRGFTAQREEEGVFHTDYVDLEGTHGLEAVTDPHFTLHPPYFHLRGKKHPNLLEGLVWTVPEPGQLSSPWIHFVSDPVRELSPFRGTPPGKQGDLIGISVPAEDLSVRVHFDFVRAPGDAIIEERRVNHIIEWHGVVLHCHAYVVPGQPATLGYLIRG